MRCNLHTVLERNKFLRFILTLDLLSVQLIKLSAGEHKTDHLGANYQRSIFVNCTENLQVFTLPIGQYVDNDAFFSMFTWKDRTSLRGQFSLNNVEVAVLVDCVFLFTFRSAESAGNGQLLKQPHNINITTGNIVRNIKNDDIWMEENIEPLTTFLRQKRLRWYDHVLRKEGRTPIIPPRR